MDLLLYSSWKPGWMEDNSEKKVLLWLWSVKVPRVFHLWPWFMPYFGDFYNFCYKVTQHRVLYFAPRVSIYGFSFCGNYYFLDLAFCLSTWQLANVLFEKLFHILAVLARHVVQQTLFFARHLRSCWSFSVFSPTYYKLFADHLIFFYICPVWLLEASVNICV